MILLFLFFFDFSSYELTYFSLLAYFSSSFLTLSARFKHKWIRESQLEVSGRGRERSRNRKKWISPTSKRMSLSFSFSLSCLQCLITKVWISSSFFTCFPAVFFVSVATMLFAFAQAKVLDPCMSLARKRRKR
jgi:hypothetical protein